ncbi:MAG: hypothetical protein HUJ51_03570 [Eggerthellaceae bacterium]|nr:hypothetical protein [Eggerthellaceae bacterium]
MLGEYDNWRFNHNVIQGDRAGGGHAPWYYWHNFFIIDDYGLARAKDPIDFSGMAQDDRFIAGKANGLCQQEICANSFVVFDVCERSS